MSQKQHYISYENQHFFQHYLKIQQPVVEFFKNVDFQRRYDAFSETPVEVILLHLVHIWHKWFPFFNLIGVWQLT